jgi:hypothetical protein
MSVVLYHGSNKIFDFFEIDKKHSTRDISTLSEGFGIYMTEDMNVSESYGENIYQIILDNKDFIDFTKRNNIKKLIENISTEININLKLYVDTNTIISMIIDGDLSITTMYEEITNLLDSNEKFYDKYQHLLTYDDNCLYKKIKSSFFKNIKSIIKYKDKSFDLPLYICIREAEKLQFKLL